MESIAKKVTSDPRAQSFATNVASGSSANSGSVSALSAMPGLTSEFSENLRNASSTGSMLSTKSSGPSLDSIKNGVIKEYCDIIKNAAPDIKEKLVAALKLYFDNVNLQVTDNKIKNHIVDHIMSQTNLYLQNEYFVAMGLVRSMLKESVLVSILNESLIKLFGEPLENFDAKNIAPEEDSSKILDFIIKKLGDASKSKVETDNVDQNGGEGETCAKVDEILKWFPPDVSSDSVNSKLMYVIENQVNNIIQNDEDITEFIKTNILTKIKDQIMPILEKDLTTDIDIRTNLLHQLLDINETIFPEPKKVHIRGMFKDGIEKYLENVKNGSPLTAEDLNKALLKEFTPGDSDQTTGGNNVKRRKKSTTKRNKSKRNNNRKRKTRRLRRHK